MMIYRIKTSLFAEEDKYGSYGHLLLKYFLAEGVMCNHSLFLASADTSTEHILKVNKYLDHKVIHTQSEESILLFLAHLWGAYAIPVALSGVRRPSFVVRRTSCVVCVHHNYQK